MVIGGSSRRFQWKPKNKKSKKTAAAGKGGSRSLVKRLRFTALICNLIFFFFFNDLSKFLTPQMTCHRSNWTLNGV